MIDKIMVVAYQLAHLAHVSFFPPDQLCEVYFDIRNNELANLGRKFGRNFKKALFTNSSCSSNLILSAELFIFRVFFPRDQLCGIFLIFVTITWHSVDKFWKQFKKALYTNSSDSPFKLLF